MNNFKKLLNNVALNEKQIARDMAWDAIDQLVENWEEMPYYNEVPDDANRSKITKELKVILKRIEKMMK